MRNRARQSGLASVELAIVGTIVMVTILTVLEIGRALFVYNALEEATRRGARMAAVCQLSDPAIAEIAVFNPSGGGANSSIVHGLDTANVSIQYLRANGTAIADPAANYADIEYVRVGVKGFDHEFFIPGVSAIFQTPQFITTLPRESLGVTREGLQQC
jgi:hypothetical protein